MPDPFISRQDLTDKLGRDVTTDAGALICVNIACDIVRDVAEQVFNQVLGETIYLDGTGTDALLLPQLPVTAAGTVAQVDSAGSWSTMGTADYVLNGNGILFASNTAGTSTFGTLWPRGRQNIRVTYDHGYSIGTAGNIPASVRGVALSVAERLLIQGPTIFENMGDLNVRYAAESTCLMPTERLILRKYRRAR